MGNFPYHDKFAFNIAHKLFFIRHHPKLTPKSLALNWKESSYAECIVENRPKESNFASQVHQLFEVHKINNVVDAINVNPPFFMQLFHDFGGFFNTDFCHLC
jgi:hypothetical protein